MKLFALLLALGLLLSGCAQETGASETQWETPAEETNGQAIGEEPAEETPEEAPAEAVEAESESVPEETVEEEELLHWDVGVTEEIDETHRKLQAVEFDGYILIVDDITDDKPYPCAALRVGEMDGTYIKTLFQDKVCPGESTYWTSAEGTVYRIKVFETAAGYMGYTYWADVAVYRQG